MHAERKNTHRSHKHSFTPYPSLGPYSQTEWLTEKRIHSLHVGLRNIFPVVMLCQFFCCGGNSFRWYLPTIPVVPLCLFCCCGGKITLLLYIPLLALTDRQNHGQRDKFTRFPWAGGTFFPVVLLCCVSFWFWREMRELALHYFPADCFGIKREIVFGVTYVLSVQYSCVVVSFYLLWRES
jgi:hypothetical protein